MVGSEEQQVASKRVRHSRRASARGRRLPELLKAPAARAAAAAASSDESAALSEEEELQLTKRIKAAEAENLMKCLSLLEKNTKRNSAVCLQWVK